MYLYINIYIYIHICVYILICLHVYITHDYICIYFQILSITEIRVTIPIVLWVVARREVQNPEQCRIDEDGLLSYSGHANGYAMDDEKLEILESTDILNTAEFLKVICDLTVEMQMGMQCMTIIRNF